MRYGCVAAPQQIAAAIAAGFDYIELPARALDAEGDHEWALRTIGHALERSHRPVKVEVFGGLLPADLPIVGPGVDPERLRRYLHRTFTGMWALGGLLAVLGSGSSRRVPEGFPRERAEAQFVEALALIESEADRCGLDLALEPLSHSATNLLNTLDESRRFLEAHAITDVRLLADIFHLTAEEEPLASVERCGALIAHVHVADAGRAVPGQATFDFGPFFQALQRIGYDERISISCNWRDFRREAAPALRFVREQWERSTGT